jgi:hypothetical protein
MRQDRTSLASGGLGRACGEIWLVDGEPVAQHVDVAAAQRPVGVEGFDFVEPELAAGVAGLKGDDEPAERWPLGREHESHPQQAADRGG